jgi:hypothetical protein
VVLGFLRPSDQDCSVAVEPGVGAFDDPAASAEAGFLRECPLLFAAGADVGGEAELTRELVDLVLLVGAIEAETLWTSSAGPGTIDRDRLDRRSGEQVVVAVRARVGYPDRDAATLGEKAPLRPFLALSVGLGPVLPPPSGALVIAPSIANHSQSIPSRSS